MLLDILAHLFKVHRFPDDVIVVGQFSPTRQLVERLAQHPAVAMTTWRQCKPRSHRRLKMRRFEIPVLVLEHCMEEFLELLGQLGWVGDTLVSGPSSSS